MRAYTIFRQSFRSKDLRRRKKRVSVVKHDTGRKLIQRRYAYHVMPHAEAQTDHDS